MVDQRNRLRIDESDPAERDFGQLAERAAKRFLRESGTTIDEVDSIVAAPAGQAFRTELATELGVPIERITVAADEHMHTAALAAALKNAARTAQDGSLLLIVAAAAGITAGAALYRM